MRELHRHCLEDVGADVGRGRPFLPWTPAPAHAIQYLLCARDVFGLARPRTGSLVGQPYGLVRVLLVMMRCHLHSCPFNYLRSPQHKCITQPRKVRQAPRTTAARRLQPPVRVRSAIPYTHADKSMTQVSIVRVKAGLKLAFLPCLPQLAKRGPGHGRGQPGPCGGFYERCSCYPQRPCRPSRRAFAVSSTGL